MIKNATEIRDKVSILHVVGEHVELKRSGANHVGHCPFHQEKSPSFTVSEAKGIYKCFGCGASGDSVAFLIDHLGLSYPEALERAAQIGGISVDYEERERRAEFIAKQKESRDKMSTLFQVMQQVQAFLLKNTWGHLAFAPEDIIAIGPNRTYTYATLEKYGVTYTPEGNHLPDVSDESLVEVGFNKSSDRGGSYPFYRDRLLFPITDHRGRICSYAGRKPYTDVRPDNPKYINGRDTFLYKKEEHLYGLHQALRHIRSMDSAVLMEGYTDVLTLSEHGYPNGVASCGTAFGTEQAKLLKRFTTNVLILRDGDAAGLKAAKNDVETLVREGIVPKVCILPDGEDPDSFARKHGESGLRFYIEEKAQDGLVWRVMSDYSEDPFLKQTSLRIAGELLACLDSASMRDAYIKELTKKNRLGDMRRILKDEMEQAEEKMLKTKSPLTDQQQEDAIHYGLYANNNKYFVTSDPNNTGFSISNFTVEGIMLVIGTEISQRVIRIRNEWGKEYTLIIDASWMTSFTDFRKQVERMGNFLFTGKPEMFDRVKAMVYGQTRDAFPINTMGWHRDGFYTWGNGVSIDGKFIPVDELGLVQHKDTRYFLPAFSKLSEQFKGDDSEDSYEFERKFCYHPEPACTSTSHWSKLMVEVHGWNGGMAVAYFVASLYRDIIFRKFQFFPHLNMFGPSGSGKTFLARSVMAMFGRGNLQDPFNLASGTPVAFKRRLSQVSNGIIWFDEYSNDIDFKRVESLKGAYDGAGHQRGTVKDGEVKTTKVRSALLLSGQQQPTKDIALFKRVVSLNCSSGKNTLEKQIVARELKNIEETGVLTQITQVLLQYRDYVEEEFSLRFEKLRTFFTGLIEEKGAFVEDRITANHLIPLTVIQMISEKIDIGFDMKAFLLFTLENIIQQSEAIFAEDELSIFWRIVQYLLESGRVEHKKDVLVEEKIDETFLNELDRDRKESVSKSFKAKTKLCYIRFSRIHPEYQDRHSKQRGKLGLELGALQYYLRGSEAYLGQKRSKKFGNASYACYVFNAELLPVELQVSELQQITSESPF